MRSLDRYLADGSLDMARGGWWELAEDRPGPHHFGALAGTDATPGWQDAINYAATTGLALHPIDGVYTLRGQRRAHRAILTIPTGVDITIAGSGRGCELRLPDGYSQGGDYRMMASADKNPMGKVSISGLFFDGNGQNNLVKDSRANIRGGYAILLFAGDAADLHDLWFENIAGRNAIVLANNGSEPSWRSVRLSNNHVKNVGGAIPGNEAQNDHSSFYIEAQSAVISDNELSNDDQKFDPQSAPLRSCTALEIHCVNAVIENNVITNYGSAGIAVAVNFDVETQIWKNNKFLDCKSNAFKPFTLNSIDHLVVSGNYIQVNNLNGIGGCGIFQDPSTSETKSTIRRLEITDNVITSMRTSPGKHTSHGVLLCAFESLSFLRNQLSYWQGDGLRIQDQDGHLGVSNANIDQCQFHNCGMQIGGSDAFAIYILNRNPQKIFSGITIGPQNLIWQDAGSRGVAPLTGRGIRVRGPGSFRQIVVHVPDMSNIAPSHRMSVIDTAKNAIKTL